MPTTYSRLHVFIGFVILAIVMNALAPNFLSAAGTALNGKTLWVQLCSAGASKFVPMVMSGPSDAHAAGSVVRHGPAGLVHLGRHAQRQQQGDCMKPISKNKWPSFPRRR
jgi:hypothetical protein